MKKLLLLYSLYVTLNKFSEANFMRSYKNANRKITSNQDSNAIHLLGLYAISYPALGFFAVGLFAVGQFAIKKTELKQTYLT